MECNRNYVLTFGKYRGKRLINLLYENPSYLLWLDKNIEDIEISDALYFQAKDLAQYDELDGLYDLGDFQDTF